MLDVPDLMASASHQLQLLVHTAGSSRVFPIPPSGVVIVGRSAQSDICVEDPAVSRRHLSLRSVDGKRVEVQDLGSANGTIVLGTSERPPQMEDTMHRQRENQLAPGKAQVLNVGACLRIGSVLLYIESRGHEGRATIRPRPGGPLPESAPQPEWSPVLIDEEMKRIYSLGRRAAASEITVLILGETGSGKEVLAEAIHRASPRASRPFLRLNCAALPENLLESELFGHERGAFTGASQTKVGLLESTNGGTVFLDEVGELPLSIQVKLLRVLEERILLRVGSTKPRPINVRFVTATNRDLKTEVERGTFRGDLYFRINGVTLHLPPLRDRKDEIEPLARLFLQQFCVRAGVTVPELSAEALEKMRDYNWPGNVRELRNVMERASFLAGDGQVLAEHVPPDKNEGLMSADWTSEVTDVFDRIPVDSRPWLGERIGRADRAEAGGYPGLDLGTPAFGVQRVRSPDPGGSSRDTPVREPPASTGDPEMDRILRALADCGGNQTRAAKMLGVSRRTLVNRLDEYNLPRPRKGRE